MSPDPRLAAGSAAPGRGSIAGPSLSSGQHQRPGDVPEPAAGGGVATAGAGRGVAGVTRGGAPGRGEPSGPRGGGGDADEVGRAEPRGGGGDVARDPGHEVTGGEPDAPDLVGPEPADDPAGHVLGDA